MKMQRFWVGRALLLAVAVLYAGGYVRAQEAKDTLTLTLDRALEIALSDSGDMEGTVTIHLYFGCSTK